MNWIVILTCLAAIVVGSCATLCRKAEDCSPERCCVALGLGPLMSKGVCLKLAKKGAMCNEPEAKLDYYGGKFITRCPCQEGLSCLPKAKYNDHTKHLLSLRCQITPVEEITTESEIKETTQEEVVEEITEEEIVDSGNQDEETTDEETGDEDTGGEGDGDEETGDEDTGVEEGGDEETGDEDTGVEGDGDEETGDEDTGVEGDGDEETGNEENEEELSEEIAGGPGGEPPRDDDCENWEYPC